MLHKGKGWQIWAWRNSQKALKCFRK